MPFSFLLSRPVVFVGSNFNALSVYIGFCWLVVDSWTEVCMTIRHRIEFTSCNCIIRIGINMYVRIYHQSKRTIPTQQLAEWAIHEVTHDRWIGRGEGDAGLSWSWLWSSLGKVSRVSSILKACTLARSVICQVGSVCSGTLKCFAWSFIRTADSWHAAASSLWLKWCIRVIARNASV